MLYRHFPKIANKEISIITVTLFPGNGQEAGYTAADLEAFGVTAAYLPAFGGADSIAGVPGPASADTLPADFPVPVIVGLRAWDPAQQAFETDWDSAIQAKKLKPEDFLLLDFTGAKDLAGAASDTVKAAEKFAWAAEQAAEGGKIAGFGFRLGKWSRETETSDPEAPSRDREAFETAARAIASASGSWSFWSTDYSMANARELDPIVKELGEEGIPLLATDPFFGGALSGVPSGVHQLYYEAPVPRAHEEWALRAIWENQDVLSAVLPASSPGDFPKRCIYAGAGRANSLPEAELKVIRAAAEKLLTQEAKYNTFKNDFREDEETD